MTCVMDEWLPEDPEDLDMHGDALMGNRPCSQTYGLPWDYICKSGRVGDLQVFDVVAIRG